ALMSLVAFAPMSVLLAADAPTPPASQPAKVEPIDYHKLKDLLPDTLAGEKRSNAEGEKTSAGEVSFSRASAEYGDTSKENAPTYHLEIFDYSATPGMGEGMAAWQNLEVDKEGDNGFEKTLKLADQPGLESYHKEGKDGSIQVWV